MNLYKITLKLKSPIVTLLKGDTIWGHYVWGIANHEGDEAVTKFLDECRAGDPPLIVSSAFPRGTVCKPIPKPAKHKDLSSEEYANIKQNKKEKYIAAEMYIIGADKTNVTESPFCENMVTHNSINRFAGTVEEGQLYAVNELWAKQSEFDLYVLSSYTAERVKKLKQWAFENGYGADSSVGKGNIEVLSSAVKVDTKQTGNTYMALAPFIADNNITDLHADTFVRTGRIGGAFVSSLSPYKKTVILFDEGAVFSCDKPLEYVGKLITDVHSDPRICQSGFAPVIPIEWRCDE